MKLLITEAIRFQPQVTILFPSCFNTKSPSSRKSQSTKHVVIFVNNYGKLQRLWGRISGKKFSSVFLPYPVVPSHLTVHPISPHTISPWSNYVEFLHSSCSVVLSQKLELNRQCSNKGDSLKGIVLLSAMRIQVSSSVYISKIQF